jgi:hypothetical protein
MVLDILLKNSFLFCVVWLKQVQQSQLGNGPHELLKTLCLENNVNDVNIILSTVITEDVSLLGLG